MYLVISFRVGKLLVWSKCKMGPRKLPYDTPALMSFKLKHLSSCLIVKSLFDIYDLIIFTYCFESIFFLVCQPNFHATPRQRLRQRLKILNTDLFFFKGMLCYIYDSIHLVNSIIFLSKYKLEITDRFITYFLSSRQRS